MDKTMSTGLLSPPEAGPERAQRNREDSEGPASGGRPDQVGVPIMAPDPEVLEKPVRRHFTAEYKLRILSQDGIAAPLHHRCYTPLAQSSRSTISACSSHHICIFLHCLWLRYLNLVPPGPVNDNVQAPSGITSGPFQGDCVISCVSNKTSSRYSSLQAARRRLFLTPTFSV
jgi:hypothetical protein